MLLMICFCMSIGNKYHCCEDSDSVAMCHLTSETTRGPKIGVESVEQKKLFDKPKSNEFLPKPDISGLCDVLHLSVGSSYTFHY